MPFRKYAGDYDPRALAIMQQAYDEACTALNFSLLPSDDAKREQVALAILALANGERTVEELRDSAILSLAGRRLDA